MAVTFFTIPIVLTPGVFVENNAAKANRGLPALPNRVVIVGSMLSTAVNTTAGVLYEMTTEDSGVRFGINSQLHKAVRFFKRKDPNTEVWAIGQLDDGGGIAHTKTITLGAGPSTAAGVYHFLVHGEERVDVLIPSGSTADVAAGLINTALGLEENIMFGSGVVGPVVTVTANHAAEFSSDLDLRLNFFVGQVDDTPPGLTLVIADVIAGATNPDITTTIAAVGDEWFTTWVLGWADNANVLALETELDLRWGGTVQQDGLAYYGAVGDHSTLLTLGGTTDSQFTLIMAAGQSPTPPWVWAAQMAAASTGLSNPAIPRQTVSLPDCRPPVQNVRFNRTERNLLLGRGISTHKVVGTNAQIERLVTTYKTGPSGLADTTYRSQNVMLQLLAIRFTTRQRISAKYPQAILVDDGTDVGPGVIAVSPLDLKGELVDLFLDWQTFGWVENVEQFKEDLIVEKSDDDPDTVDAVMSPDLANQFIAMRVRNDFLV